MIDTPQTPMTRMTGALLLLQVLAFAAGVVPEHLATLSADHECAICALIHHPPLLQAGDIAPIGLILQAGLLAPIAAKPALPETRAESGPSRAPPAQV